MYSSPELKIIDAGLEDDNLIVYLSDRRIIIYPLAGMSWLTEAPPEQKQDFTIANGEIYWEQIDDGLTLEHILSPKPRVDFTVEKHPNWERFRKVVATYQETSRLLPQQLVEDQTRVEVRKMN